MIDTHGLEMRTAQRRRPARAGGVVAGATGAAVVTGGSVREGGLTH